MNKVYSVEEVSTMLSPIFSTYQIKKAVLFGSYGKNTATEKSDIDLMVDSGLRGLQFIDFSETLRNTLHKDMDIFDVNHITPNSLIHREIQETGVVIYEK